MKKTVALVPVCMELPAGPSGPSLLDVGVREGRRIQVPNQFSEDGLIRLLQARLGPATKI